jgi:hypothetical protein
MWGCHSGRKYKNPFYIFALRLLFWEESPKDTIARSSPLGIDYSSYILLDASFKHSTPLQSASQCRARTPAICEANGRREREREREGAKLHVRHKYGVSGVGYVKFYTVFLSFKSSKVGQKVNICKDNQHSVPAWYRIHTKPSSPLKTPRN